MTSRSIRRNTLMAAVASAALAVAGLGAHPAYAQAANRAEAAVRFNLDAGPLAPALTRFADAADIQLLYPTELTEGLRTGGLRGTYPASEGLSRLLAGTGLTFRFLDARTVQIERPVTISDDGSRVLGPVMVEGVQGAGGAGRATRGEGVAQIGGERGGQDDEAAGYRAFVASIGAGAPTPIEDIPRSISVLTQEQIEKQDVTDIADALRRLPGVTFEERGANQNNFTEGAYVYARGFRISSVQLDGGAPQRLDVIGNGMLDMAAFERVELVRGPNGAHIGANSPGGSLNLVRKRPGVEESFDVTGLVGSFDRYRLALDYSTPSVGGSAVAFRGVATLEDQGFWYDKANSLSALLYGIIDAPLGDKARFEAGMRYSTIERNGSYQGIPRYMDGPLFEAPDFYANPYPEWTFADVQDAELFSRLYVDLFDAWDLELGADYSVRSHDGVDARASLSFISSGLSLGDSIVSGNRQEGYNEQLGVDLKLSGQFSTFGLRHNLYVAADYNSVYHQGRVWGQVDGPYVPFLVFDTPEDFFAGNWPEPDWARDPYYTNWGPSWNQGLVIADTISWRDRIDLSLSARRYASGNNSQTVNKARGYDVSTRGMSEVTKVEPRWVPSYALAIHPLRGLTVYGSFSQGVTPQDNYYTEEGDPLDPATFKNEEVGLKYGTDSWLATLSAYELYQANVASPVPGNADQCPPGTSGCYFPGGDTVESKGYDFELTGRLFGGLSVLASYNYNENRRISTNTPQQRQTPASTYKLQLDWIPSFLPRASIQAGVSYRDSITVSGIEYLFDGEGNYLGYQDYVYTTAPYSVVDLGLEYALTDELTARVFVENLLDEEYLSSTSGDAQANFPGAPRSFMVSLRFRDIRTDGPVGGPIFAAPFGEPRDWYGVVDLGLHRSEARMTSFAAGGDGDRVTWDFEQDDILSSAGRLGYRISPALRGELEIAYRRSQIARISGDPDVTPYGVCSVAFAYRGVTPDCSKADGEFDNAALMGNLLFDFGAEDARLRPFVGLGAGLSRSVVSFGGKLAGVDDPALPPLRELYEQLGITPLPVMTAKELIVADDSSLTFAWQAMAGLSYRLNDRATLDATWRYFDTSGVEIRSGNDPDLSPDLQGFRGGYSDQAVMLGFRWAFGASD